MKQFIVFAALLPIMLLFISQFTLETVRSIRMHSAEDAVRAFCIEASYYKGGGQIQSDALRARLAQIFKADERDIYIDMSKPDDAHINWRISFPVGDIMAAPGFMGLSNAENAGRADLYGTIVIAPDPPPPPENPPPRDESETGEAGTDESDIPSDIPDEEGSE